MTDSTYQTKVYTKQGGDELVVAIGGKITVEAGGTIDVSAGTLTPGTNAIADNAVTTAKLAAGAVTLPKIGIAGIKCLAAAGKNGAGAVTLTGTAVGDRVVAVFRRSHGGRGARSEASSYGFRGGRNRRRPDPAGLGGKPVDEDLRFPAHSGGGIAMRVRLKTLMAGPQGVFQPGSIIDPPAEEAEALISAGYAERLERPPETAGVETATIDPGGRATRTPARPRKTP